MYDKGYFVSFPVFIAVYWSVICIMILKRFTIRKVTKSEWIHRYNHNYYDEFQHSILKLMLRHFCNGIWTATEFFKSSVPRSILYLLCRDNFKIAEEKKEIKTIKRENMSIKNVERRKDWSRNSESIGRMQQFRA